MDNMLRPLGWLALLATAAAPLLYFFDVIGEPGMRTSLVIAMVVWFGVAVVRQRTQTD
jgi:hypothetical protein